MDFNDIKATVRTIGVTETGSGDPATACRAQYIDEKEEHGRFGYGPDPVSAADALAKEYPPSETDFMEKGEPIDAGGMVKDLLVQLAAEEGVKRVARSLRQGLLAQHERSGPEGLRVSFGDEGMVTVDGKVDVDRLAKRALTAASGVLGALHDLTQPPCPNAKRLKEAEDLLKRVMDHEGAEGWSDGLKGDLSAFFKGHDEEPKEGEADGPAAG